LQCGLPSADQRYSSAREATKVGVPGCMRNEAARKVREEFRNLLEIAEANRDDDSAGAQIVAILQAQPKFVVGETQLYDVSLLGIGHEVLLN